MERSCPVLDGLEIEPGEEAGHEASVGAGAQLEVNYGSGAERRGPVRVGNVFGIRDGLSKLKKKSKGPLVK